MKDKADLCIWLSEALKASDDIDVFWRILKKFMDDFETDNNLRIELREKEKN